MLNDGPRRFGRFIKKGSKVLDKVNLYEFSFKEINETPSVMHDNAERTIIHSKYHETSEIDAAVHSPDKFDEDLMPDSQRRPVLMPLDFTRDWERDKKMRKARAARGEDDDLEFEYQEELKQQAEEDEEAQIAASRAARSAKPETPSTGPAPSPVASTANAATPSSGRPEGPITHDSLNVVGRAIKDLINTGPISQEFVAVPQAALANEGLNPEEAAIDLYKQRLEQQLADQKANEERARQLFEEAKARGYQEGFKVGEEKAEIKVRESGMAVFGKVGELIQELGGLKHQILNNVQENFYELCQGMAEALLRREFSIKPDAFVSVMRRAISEAVEPGRIKLRVNPEMFDKLQELKVKDLEGQVVRDPELSKGDFRIESDMSVVDVNVSKLIGELLEQADLNLFDGDNVATADAKKAG